MWFERNIHVSHTWSHSQTPSSVLGMRLAHILLLLILSHSKCTAHTLPTHSSHTPPTPPTYTLHSHPPPPHTHTHTLHSQSILSVHETVRTRSYETPVPSYDPNFHPQTNYQKHKGRGRGPEYRTIGLHKSANEPLVSVV